MVLFCHLTGKIWHFARAFCHILPFCPGNLPHSSIPNKIYQFRHLSLNSPISTHPTRHTTYLRPLKELRRSCIPPTFFRAAKPPIYVARQSHRITAHPGRWGRGLPGRALYGLYRSCKGAASAGHKNSRYKWATKELHLSGAIFFIWFGLKKFYILKKTFRCSTKIVPQHGKILHFWEILVLDCGEFTFVYFV